MVTEDSQVAAALRAELTARIGSQRYDLWFGAHTQLSVGQSGLVVRSASPFLRDWLRRHFLRDLRACCQNVVGEDVAVEFLVDASLPQPHEASPHPAADDAPDRGDDPKKAAPGRSPTATACKEHNHSPNAARRRTQTTDPSPRAPDANFADFVLGPSNEYAFRSAQLVTLPGAQGPSPVLMYGPTGVGKTHLLRAVRAEYLNRNRRSRAVYLTAEQFTTAFVEAVRGSGLPSFRQKCRGADLLLIDDLQFFTGKRATLEELLHTVDTLIGEGRQLVLASDRGLAELSARGGLGPELVSRLAGGLVCEIRPPEFATRLGILRRLREGMQMDVADEVLTMVATHITAGARELRGALHRLQALSLTSGQPIAGDTVEAALVDLAQQSTRVVRLADVEQAVCHVFGVEPNQLRSDRKGRSVCEPRMLAMWLARKYTRAPFSEIGQYFGRRSHSTVISAHRRVERLMGDKGLVDLSNQRCTVDEAIRRVEAALRSA